MPTQHFRHKLSRALIAIRDQYSRRITSSELIHAYCNLTAGAVSGATFYAANGTPSWRRRALGRPIWAITFHSPTLFEARGIAGSGALADPRVLDPTVEQQHPQQAGA